MDKEQDPKEIITMFVERWVGIFGAPKRLLNDNGLEFQNEEVGRQVPDRIAWDSGRESLEQWSL